MAKGHGHPQGLHNGLRRAPTGDFTVAFDHGHPLVKIIINVTWFGPFIKRAITFDTWVMTSIPFFFPSLSSFGGHINGLHLLHETWALGLGPSPSHYSTPTLQNIILFIIPQGFDFHGSLPLIGTYGIEPWD